MLGVQISDALDVVRRHLAFRHDAYRCVVYQRSAAPRRSGPVSAGLDAVFFSWRTIVFDHPRESAENLAGSMVVSLLIPFLSRCFLSSALPSCLRLIACL
ncbi:MAG: hypothetical protein JW941_13075 [Candidatus Coatesbacteria bacterium]|nr:hypothetical protein [Candidatus Coatesbacteria bacterium]